MGLRIAVAGASGFVGQELIKRLLLNTDHLIRGLSRSVHEQNSNERLQYTPCDLFSLKDAERALEGIDVGIYLVHSMSPTASLDQGSFQDYDLILADNFARAAKKNGIKQIIYLSGIIPKDSEMSEHLSSRFEVEEVFRSHDLQVTALRAGMIVGNGGSSATILMKIVDRMPVLFSPPWAKLKSQPVDVQNVIEAIEYTILRPSCFNRYYDLGGPDILTYEEMLRVIASVIHKKRPIIQMPIAMFNVIRVTARWISGAPKNLVNPLVGSLKHEVVADPAHALHIPGQRWIGFQESIQKALHQGCLKTEPVVYRHHQNISKLKIVRSVQRMPLPSTMKADSVAFAYQHWLQKFLRPFLKIKKESNMVSFIAKGLAQPLLKLELSYQRSSPNRQLFYIRGGLLTMKETRGRLEFREVLNGRYMMAAIHDFKPRIPWWIYVLTQAPLHLFVMKSFSAWLNKAKMRHEYKYNGTKSFKRPSSKEYLKTAS